MNSDDFFKKYTRDKDLFILHRAEDKISTELDGETVILDLAGGNYSGLNEVGTSIWNLLEKPKSFSAILSSLQQEYEMSENQCNSDMTTFLKELVDNDLITINKR